MTTQAKSIIALVLAVVIGGAIYGAYQYPKYQATVSSTAGTTFLTAKFAGVSVSLANPGTTGTTSSILNTDAGTRYVTGVRAACDSVGTSYTAYTGTGLASLTLSIGTSSTASANTIGATAKVLTNGIIATSTYTNSFATSTSQLGSTAQSATLWHTGEYMNFQSNATNTAACTFGVDYVQS